VILNDRKIRKLCLNPFVPMITPFSEAVSAGVISYGLSSFGYDIRVSDKMTVFTDMRLISERVGGGTLDPKAFDPRVCMDISPTDGYFVLPSHSFALAHSVEHFNIPPNVMVLAVGKSTYARCSLAVTITPLEPEWSGHLTIEMFNQSPFPMKVYANEGICQLLFWQGEYPDITYADKGGKYQNQPAEPVLPIVSGLAPIP